MLLRVTLYDIPLPSPHSPFLKSLEKWSPSPLPRGSWELPAGHVSA